MPFEHGPNWRGGQRVDQSGHMRVWDASLKQYVLRSHQVWLAAHPGETIPRGYIIHHRDGDKLNDVIENLERIPLAEHVARHRRPAETYIKELQALLDAAGIVYPPRHRD